MSRRSRSREVALQVLFQDDLNPCDPHGDASPFLKQRLNAEDLLKLGLRNQARRLFELSIQESPQNAKAYYQLAELFQEDGETDNAIKYFGLAAAVDPSYDLSEQFILSATAYRSKDEFAKAAESYILLFENYPEHEQCAYAGYQAAFLLTENVEAFDQALELLMQVTEKFPENGDYEKAQYLIGKLQVETNQNELAISTLTNFILTYTTSQWLPYAYTMRGRAFLKLHQNQSFVFGPVNFSSEIFSFKLLSSFKPASSSCFSFLLA